MKVEERPQIGVITWNSEDGGWGADVVRINPYDAEDDLLHEVDAVYPTEEEARDAARCWIGAEGITATPIFM
jgi:hypothetical protein